MARFGFKFRILAVRRMNAFHRPRPEEEDPSVAPCRIRFRNTGSRLVIANCTPGFSANWVEPPNSPICPNKVEKNANFS